MQVTIMRAARKLLAIAFIAAVATSPAWSGSANGTTTITMNTGNSIAITVMPTTETLSQDVVSPGPDWTYYSTAQSWFPAGVTNGWVYSPSGTPGCTSAAVTTFKNTWSLTAYFTLNPSTAPLEVYLADATASCTAPAAGSAVAISSSSSSPTTLASGLSNNQTKKYYLLIAPTGGSPIGGTTTITLTYTAL